MAKNVVTLNFNNTDYSLRPYATCSTAATTAAKTVTISGFTLCNGATVLVKFTNGNTAESPTLNVNSTGAKSIKFGNDASPVFKTNDTYEFVYNGTNWDLIGIDNAIYESKLQWGDTAIAGSLSPLDVAMDSQWSSNRLSFMPASGINIEYSTDGGTTWTDYGASDAEKRSFVTTGLSYPLSPGKNTTRQKINSDRVRVTITAEYQQTYFSLKKIYMYISQNGASGCKVIIEKAKCGSDTTFTQVGEYSISGWSGWNSIPLTANFGGGDGQTSNIRRLRFTYYFTTYATDYGEANDKLAVKWTINKLNMIGETSWANSGGNLPTTGHIYSYDINKNVTFPANLTSTGTLIVKGNTTLGDATSDTVTITGPATLNSSLTVKGNTTLGDATSDTITAKTSILPSGTINLGSASAKWNNVYINNINGTAISSYALKTDIPTIPAAYELPTADNDTLGGIKTNYTIDETNKNYPVKVDNSGNAYVNVPWTGGSSAGASSHITVQAVTGTSYSNKIPANTILDFTSTNVSGTINITGFESATETDKLTTYGLTFKTLGNATLKWPSSKTIYWVNGEYPGAVNPGSALPAAVYEIIITYAPGSNRYTATYAKYK